MNKNENVLRISLKKTRKPPSAYAKGSASCLPLHRSLIPHIVGIKERETPASRAGVPNRHRGADGQAHCFEEVTP